MRRALLITAAVLVAALGTTLVWLWAQNVAAQQPVRVVRVPVAPPPVPAGVPKGLEAVALTITGPAQVPAVLRPGSDVSLYAAARLGAVPTLVLAHVHVQTVGSRKEDGNVSGDVNVPATIIGFVAPPADVVKIVQIQSSGEVPILVINGQGADPVSLARGKQ